MFTLPQKKIPSHKKISVGISQGNKGTLDILTTSPWPAQHDFAASLFQSPSGALARFTGRKNERTIQQQQKQRFFNGNLRVSSPQCHPPPGNKALLGDY